MVAVFTVGSTSPSTEAWVRMTRQWRRGIPAIIGTFDDPNPANARDAELHNETWVTWKPRRDVKYPGEAFMPLVAMTLALAADQLKDAEDVEWILFGDDDTVFNMDVVAETVARFDASEPHLLTDHLWFRYNGTNTRHGSPLAPRCVACGVKAAPIPKIKWTPPEACPRCTWDLLRRSDPTRPNTYNAQGYRPGYLPNYEMIAHGGAGMIISRKLYLQLGSDYMHTCITTKFQRVKVPGSDTLTSHCIFMLNVAATDPGTFAAKRIQAFAPNACQTKCAVDDAYNYAKGFNCCDKDCQDRLRFTVSTHIRSAHFADQTLAMQSLHSLARARDVYLYARELELTGRAVHKLGAWDQKAICL